MRWSLGFLFFATISVPAAGLVQLSPTALVASSDGKALYLACATSNCVLCFDVARQKVSDSITMPESPSGLALSANGRRLYVTCAAPESKVCIVDLKRRKIVGTIPVGHTAMAPVISPDAKTLYVCNCFNNDVSVIDLKAKKELQRIGVSRQPVAADLTRDGKFLLVANQLPAGRADAAEVAAVVSVIDLAKGKEVKEIHLPNGSGSLKDIRVSPDGKYAVVSHLVGRINQPMVQVRFGWINANALTIIDVAQMEVRYSLLLDEQNRGAGNPWGVAWSADGKTLAVAHAGTHEVSLIDFPKLLAGLPALTNTINKSTPVLSFLVTYDGLDDGLPYLTGARERVALAPGDYGPRAMVFAGQTLYTANYFSDTLDAIDLKALKHQAVSIPLGPKPEMDAVRRGEFYFHDAALCLQGWQSCSSCHPGNARVDGFNWDLLNDGIGNPKNTKSLLLAHKTPPSMSLGVRANAETAVRAGIKFILFTKQPEDVAASIDEYLKSLTPVPSPYLIHGKLSEAAERGRELFSKASCTDCHTPGLYTDLHPHDVGTRNQHDNVTDKFYTPTLIEVWRTAPYLHDGSAATIRDVLTTRNQDGLHGDVSDLSSQELDDLCTYVLSL
ncbi:MAG: c-type cytochrome [Verrucomicrobiia bacterium]|jgi:YVTN family beta-propeller protein